MPDPTWALYRAALVEPDPIRLNGRIEAAQRSIRQRLEQIEVIRMMLGIETASGGHRRSIH